MSAVTIYLEPPVERRLRQAAKTAGMPVSRFVADLIRERTADAWPAEITDLAGTWNDVDDMPIRRVADADAPRATW